MSSSVIKICRRCLRHQIVYSNLILLPSAHHREVEVGFEQDFIFDEARKGEGVKR